jgi:phenylpropionate dioxygenase-like ring-hydroxylating dioxygenase large terminal subunit
VAKVVLDTPLVIWRLSDGAVGCVLDRCPHRSVPLSMGVVRDGELECAYHGWRFDRSGMCTRVPGLADQSRGPGACATSFPVVEQQGFVWVWMDPSVEPTGEPFRFRLADDPAYTTVREALPAPGSLYHVIENALDVPHTAFLHGGLFRRDGKRRPVQVQVRRWRDRCEAQFIGESRPQGLVGRLLLLFGGVVTHFDRFYLPSIIEVEYRIGDENHIVLNGACTPVSDYETVLHAVVSFRTRLPGWLVKLVVKPIALRIFAQDVVMLRRQVRSIAEQGQERYLSTELDLLGPTILALLKRAAQGKVAESDDSPSEREVSILL